MMNLKNRLDEIRSITGSVCPLRCIVELLNYEEIEISPKEYAELVPLLQQRWAESEFRSNMRLIN
jgi:hypothetical protein